MKNDIETKALIIGGGIAGILTAYFCRKKACPMCLLKRIKYVELCKNIDCDYEIKDNYVYSCDNRKEVEDEITALSQIGYNAVLKENHPLPIDTVGAVCFENQAQFHPLKFLFSNAKI